MLEPYSSKPKFLMTKKTFKATALSIILGGVGQWYLGQRNKGILIILLVWIGFIINSYLGFALIGLGMLDAFLIARRVQNLGSVKNYEFFWNKVKRVWQIVDIIATEKKEEPIGTEKRSIDNSKSSSTLRRNLSFKKEWSQSYNIEYEKSRDKTHGLSLNVSVMSLNNTAVDTLKEKFAISQETKRELEEDIEIEVLPGKKVMVLLHWKHILQVGNIVYRDQYREQIEIPFSVVSGLTFDQQQVEE